MKRICVFTGSSLGARTSFADAAAGLGRLLAERGIGLVYGGARVGLMEILADSAMQAGGEVIGVIPQLLVDREIAHRDITELRVVTSMHERKALMAELSNGFVALPGALGTMEEFFEVLTWAQLGYHAKPCGLLNVDGFYHVGQIFRQRREGPGVGAAAVLFDALARSLAQLAQARPSARHTDDGKASVAPFDHGVERREDLLVSQVAGGAEQDEGV
jgi:uncharacterized protein (TIGR00730 family)